jgi:hypothetical protein
MQPNGGRLDAQSLAGRELFEKGTEGGQGKCGGDREAAPRVVAVVVDEIMGRTAKGMETVYYSHACAHGTKTLTGGMLCDGGVPCIRFLNFEGDTHSVSSMQHGGGGWEDVVMAAEWDAPKANWLAAARGWVINLKIFAATHGKEEGDGCQFVEGIESGGGTLEVPHALEEW